MKNNEVTEIEQETISSFIVEFLEGDEDFDSLTKDEQDKTFGIYSTILNAVHRSSFYENVYPIIYVVDTKSKEVVEKAMNRIIDIVPEVGRITVQLVN